MLIKSFIKYLCKSNQYAEIQHDYFLTDIYNLKYVFAQRSGIKYSFNIYNKYRLFNLNKPKTFNVLNIIVSYKKILKAKTTNAHPTHYTQS